MKKELVLGGGQKGSPLKAVRGQGSISEGTQKPSEEARSEVRRKNVPERGDSMCKGLGTRMSLPMTKTLEHRPDFQVPHLPAAKVAD